MGEMNFDWDDLKLFLCVARSGGLSGAAKETGKSPPTLGRRMAALENAIGKELFIRNARGYELTEKGQVLLTKVAALETQINPLTHKDEGNRRALVKISAGSWMTHALCQNVQRITEGNASALLRFISAEHVLDINHREAVIGIRNQRPEQNGLACRKVGEVQFAAYAIDKSIDEWIGVAGKTPSARWLLEQRDLSIAMEVSAPRNALDLAKMGAGRALLPTFIGDAETDLERVTSVVTELTHDQWLVTHNEERFVPQIRQTIDRVYKVVRSLHRR